MNPYTPWNEQLASENRPFACPKWKFIFQPLGRSHVNFRAIFVTLKFVSWATATKPTIATWSMKSWLVHRDPYNGLLDSVYNWIVYSQYTANDQGQLVTAQVNSLKKLSFARKSWGYFLQNEAFGCMNDHPPAFSNTPLEPVPASCVTRPTIVTWTMKTDWLVRFGKGCGKTS